MAYSIKYSLKKIVLSEPWDGSQWQLANEVSVTFPFAENNPNFTPKVRFRMLYDDTHICGLFRVEDRYVIARAQKDQDAVYEDSCVEFFTIPYPDGHYYNFEMNCGGKILLYQQQVENQKQSLVIPQEDLDTIERFHTLPERITEEITDPVTWYLGFGIPISFFVKYSHINPELAGQTWRGNFTKCADRSSHPCWLSYLPLSKLNFHLPLEFGDLFFEPASKS